MKMQTTHKSRRTLLAAAATVLVVSMLAAGIWWLVAVDSSETKVNDIDYSAPSEDQVEAGDQTAEQTHQDTSPENGRDDENRLPTAVQSPDASQPLGSDVGAINITVANQDGSNLSIRTLIQGGHNDGACTLQLLRGSTIAVREEAKVQMVASNYTCMGFDIDTSRLIGGDYRIDLTYRGGGQTYTATQTITLR